MDGRIGSKQIKYEGVHWIQLGDDKIPRWALSKMVMDFWFAYKAGSSLTM